MAAVPHTLREKAAQLLFTRIGSNMPPAVTVAEDAERIGALLDRCPLGGLVLFNGTLSGTPGALAALQRRSRFPLLIGADIERGTGQQIKGATVFPHAMAYSALGDAATVMLEASARVTAQEALACGLHITFSPVGDVNSDPRNPIIATRAFGTEAGAVAPLVEAYIRGCRAEGLLTATKHFPGHGNTSTDSHDGLPVVTRTRAELAATDLPPFQAAIDAGVDLVMTAHVAFPALDASGGPATASAPILKKLLREEMGFTGSVITDSLLMAGIRDRYPDAGQQAVALLQAGVDILLDVAEPEVALAGLLDAVAEGRLDAAVIEQAYERVWALKQRLMDRFGPTFFTASPGTPALDAVGGAAHRNLAATVAARSLTVVRATPDGPPFDPAAVQKHGLLVILLKPNRTRMDPPEEPLGAALRAVLPAAQYVEAGPEAEVDTYERLTEQAATVQHVVVAMIVKPAAWHRFGLLPVQQQFVEALLARRPVVLASLGIPYILDAFPAAAAALCTYSDVAPAQEALARHLAGVGTREADS